MKAAVAMMLALSPALAAGGRLVEGNSKSPVRVIIYEDLQCPDCAAFRRMMDEHLLPRFAGKVAFEHHDFPLPKHAWARQAAIAARHFDRVSPELGVKFRRHILASIRETTAENLPGRLRDFARANGADAESAVEALSDGALVRLVQQDLEEGVARGVGKTPTVLVDGAPFVERFPVEEIARAIEKAVAGAKWP